MNYPSELKILINKRETLIDKYISNYLVGDIKKIIIKEEWIMLDELREKYATKLQELETQDIEIFVEEKLNEVKEQIRQEVIAKHNDEILIARFKVQAVDEMIADQQKEFDNPEGVDEADCVNEEE